MARDKKRSNSRRNNNRKGKGNKKGNSEKNKNKSDIKDNAEKMGGINDKKEVKGERRKDKRIPVELEVRYSTHQSFAIDWITNISKGGMFIKTENPLPQGTQVEIKFSIPEHDEIISVEGEVRWVATPSHGESIVPGMGIQITKIDDKNRKLLEEFLEKQKI